MMFQPKNGLDMIMMIDVSCQSDDVMRMKFKGAVHPKMPLNNVFFKSLWVILAVMWEGQFAVKLCGQHNQFLTH